MVLFGLLSVFSLIGLVNTCQSITGGDSDDGRYADSSHTHASEAVWHAQARQEAGLYVAGGWAAMAPFPGQDDLSDRLGDGLLPSLPEVERTANLSWSRAGDAETHRVLVETRGGNYEVELVLSGEAGGATIVHAAEPSIVPTRDGPDTPDCRFVEESLPEDAKRRVDDWASAWLGGDAAGLVRIADADAEGTTFRGFGGADSPAYGLLELVAVTKACGIGDGDSDGDYLTVTMFAANCADGRVIPVSQNIALVNRNTADPEIPRWAPVGETPVDQSVASSETPTGANRPECEGLVVAASLRDTPREGTLP